MQVAREARVAAAQAEAEARKASDLREAGLAAAKAIVEAREAEASAREDAASAREAGLREREACLAEREAAREKLLMELEAERAEAISAAREKAGR